MMSDRADKARTAAMRAASTAARGRRPFPVFMQFPIGQFPLSKAAVLSFPELATGYLIFRQG
jgi:hypothetical protein